MNLKVYVCTTRKDNILNTKQKIKTKNYSNYIFTFENKIFGAFFYFNRDLFSVKTCPALLKIRSHGTEDARTQTFFDFYIAKDIYVASHTTTTTDLRSC